MARSMAYGKKNISFPYTSTSAMHAPSVVDWFATMFGWKFVFILRV